MTQVAVNGRYLVHQVTGMQRYAREIVSRLGSRCEIVEPQQNAKGVRGHLWEQFTLPGRLRRRLLWSPCSTGPLAVARQVVTIHDCAFVDRPECFSRPFAAWYQWLVPRLARRAHRIITVSKFSQQRIAEYCRVPVEKISVIYNGVDERFRPQDPQQVRECMSRLRLPDSYLLCVGSLEPRKNIRRLLAAWDILAPKYPDVWLVLTGTQRGIFRDAGLAHPPPRIHLTGYIDDGDLPRVYAGAKLFLYPSNYEGFGLPVAEAMACGAAVVCSNTTSLPEVAGKAAEYVDPSDVDSITSGVRRLLENGERRNELQALGIAQSKSFRWDLAADQTWRVLQSSNNGLRFS